MASATGASFTSVTVPTMVPFCEEDVCAGDGWMTGPAGACAKSEAGTENDKVAQRANRETRMVLGRFIWSP